MSNRIISIYKSRGSYDRSPWEVFTRWRVVVLIHFGHVTDHVLKFSSALFVAHVASNFLESLFCFFGPTPGQQPHRRIWSLRANNYFSQKKFFFNIIICVNCLSISSTCFTHTQYFLADSRICRSVVQARTGPIGIPGNIPVGPPFDYLCKAPYISVT